MSELAEVRKAEAEGPYFVRRLEAIRAHFKLNPPDPEEADEPQAVEVIRTICSDGLV